MWSIAKFGAVVVLLGGTGAAQAEMVTERVRSFDPGAQVIILDDGRALALRPGLDTSALEPGREVMLYIETIGTIDIVTELHVN